ncbi:TNF receptor-associated factor 3-like [Hydractinia symbiolongicarpus]|uniref:TNF receptor-associated factor 3-like n=1 Tax=Hydractinia symbiolongicarpus TaxID=13093 RepID=UPI00254B31F8|nr:TNF receptor-associated factor 3-like [Hydractinia symbiolongicarpus]
MLENTNLFNDLQPVIKKGKPSLCSTASSDLQGYDVLLQDGKQHGYLQCPLCKKLMRNPIQTFRGELACETCYKNAMHTGICPIDNEPITEKQIFPDQAKRKEIKALRCFCENEKLGCEWEGTIALYEQHELSCQYKPINCPFCNDGVSNLEEHMQTCSMIKEQEHCPFKEAGCTYKPVASNDLLKHLQSNTYIHIAMLVSTINMIKIDNSTLQAQLNINQTSIAKIKENTDKEMSRLSDTIVLLTEQLRALQDDMSQVTREVDKLKNTRLNEEKTITKPHPKDEAIQNEVSLMRANLSDLDLRQQLMENTTFNGKMLWKIDNYEKRLQQAKIGEVTALHSAPCFTNRYGYKFCARLYLFGDGMGKGTHLSLFFVLMKSEFDNVLQWPFQKQVTFRLIQQGQKGTTKEVKESFFADKSSSSFQKPTKEMNIAAGCPLFISHKDLKKGGFIEKDSLFIEVTVKA